MSQIGSQGDDMFGIQFESKTTERLWDCEGKEDGLGSNGFGAFSSEWGSGESPRPYGARWGSGTNGSRSQVSGVLGYCLFGVSWPAVLSTQPVKYRPLGLGFPMAD